jgi:hypothetical protein
MKANELIATFEAYVDELLANGALDEDGLRRAIAEGSLVPSLSSTGFAAAIHGRQVARYECEVRALGASEYKALLWRVIEREECRARQRAFVEEFTRWFAPPPPGDSCDVECARAALEARRRLEDVQETSVEKIFERLLLDAFVAARPRARGVDEVDWIVRFHKLVGQNLESELASVYESQAGEVSVLVQSALVHGNPFQVRPQWAHAARSVEIGDLLIVGECCDAGCSVRLRQGLLLQMKVGEPRVGSRRVLGTTAQAALYAEWPPITWRQLEMFRELPGPFPRTPEPGPSCAAQFGLIPATHVRPRADEFTVRRVQADRTLYGDQKLAAALARAALMRLGVDATPGPDDGWARIVEDILSRARIVAFRGDPRAVGRARGPRRRRAGDPVPTPAAERPFLVIVATVAPGGTLDVQPE